jgi:hypothetical protein
MGNSLSRYHVDRYVDERMGETQEKAKDYNFTLSCRGITTLGLNLIDQYLMKRPTQLKNHGLESKIHSLPRFESRMIKKKPHPRREIS